MSQSMKLMDTLGSSRTKKEKPLLIPSKQNIRSLNLFEEKVAQSKNGFRIQYRKSQSSKSIAKKESFNTFTRHIESVNAK